ncbi:MAG: pseudaminic acid cytidylyltransferase [Lachnospiraceae bacterium]|nr:pseudaminic acid cytidylyltransferase [Lachnospiraceae bacterium]
MKDSIAIITARGGSKRIPKKNIRDFCGKPIIAYAIEAALEAGIYDRVMVSTDSEEIAEIAKKYGAEVPFLRSEKTASDYATTADVLLEVLDRYKERGEEFKYMTCIYPTAPFVTAEKLKEAYALLSQENVVEIMPVTAFSYPPLRGYIKKDGKLAMKWPEHYKTRSQDLEPIYHDVGQFYCYCVEAYQKLNGIVTEGIVPVLVDEMEVQDIDNETDWKIAEIKYQIMKEQKNSLL